MGKDRKPNARGQAKGKWNKFGKLNKKDLPGLAQGFGITVVIAILFYKSWLGLLVGLIIVPFWLIQYRANAEDKRRSKIKQEFKEYMILISNSLQTGYSLERALKQSEAELIKLFGKEALLLKPVHEMNAKIQMNIQVEQAFEEFAKAIDLEDAESLSEILSFSKRSGGDYSKHIRNTAMKIEEKLMVEQDIETMTAEKRLELKVMCMMPVGILGYIAVSSSEFIEPLYYNAIGIGLMSICLVIYGAMIVLGRKIVAIDV